MSTRPNLRDRMFSLKAALIHFFVHKVAEELKSRLTKVMENMLANNYVLTHPSIIIIPSPSVEVHYSLSFNSANISGSLPDLYFESQPFSPHKYLSDNILIEKH